jgi:APA family basic amino acid/polyamine antiporter
LTLEPSDFCNDGVNGSRIQNCLTVLNFFLVLVFIIVGFAFGQGAAAHFLEPSGMRDFSAESFAVALIFVSFSYSGWNAAAYLGGEIKKPQRNIPLSLVSGTILVTGLYLMLNSVYVYSMPVDQMKGVIDIGARSAQFLFGVHISRFFSIAVAIGILSAVSAMIMTGPRIYYSMAKDGIFFRKFGQVNPGRFFSGLLMLLWRFKRRNLFPMGNAALARPWILGRI